MLGSLERVSAIIEVELSNGLNRLGFFTPHQRTETDQVSEPCVL
jgi:hypothetical protein